MIGSRSPVPLLLAAVLLLGLAFAPHAAASIYWANDKGTTIGTANIDGTGVNQNFITAGPNPCGVAADGAHLYWGDSGDGTIGRSNLDGAGVNPGFIGARKQSLRGGGRRRAHLLGQPHRRDDRPRQPRRLGGQPRPRRRRQLPLRSGGRRSASLLGQPDGRHDRSRQPRRRWGNQSFIVGAHVPCGVAVDGAHIYWANGDDGTIGRANLDGSRADQGFITGGNRPCGVAVDGGHIYWANGDDGTIGRANLDGTGANQGFINGATAPCGVAVDVPPPAASPAPPSNVFTLGKPKLNQRRGTAQLPVTVPAPGELALSGGGLAAAKAVRVAAGRAQTAVLLVIRARGAKLRKLVRTGRVAVKPTITYTPDGGVLNTRSTKIALIRR